MAAFSTPFWMAVASVAALAAGVSYLARPQEGERLQSSARVLGELAGTRADTHSASSIDDDTSSSNQIKIR